MVGSVICRWMMARESALEETVNAKEDWFFRYSDLYFTSLALVWPTQSVLFPNSICSRFNIQSPRSPTWAIKYHVPHDVLWLVLSMLSCFFVLVRQFSLYITTTINVTFQSRHFSMYTVAAIRCFGAQFHGTIARWQSLYDQPGNTVYLSAEQLRAFSYCWIQVHNTMITLRLSCSVQARSWRAGCGRKMST